MTIHVVGFVHGLESGIGGRKARFLKTSGIGTIKTCYQPSYPLNVLFWPWTMWITLSQLKQDNVDCVIASSFGAIILWYLILFRMWKRPSILMGLPTYLCFGSCFIPDHVKITYLFGKEDWMSTVSHRIALHSDKTEVIQVDDTHSLNQHLHLLPSLVREILR
jgi:hypothetical protein